jgi:hypothetical protein
MVKKAPRIVKTELLTAQAVFNLVLEVQIRHSTRKIPRSPLQ